MIDGGDDNKEEKAVLDLLRSEVEEEDKREGTGDKEELTYSIF